MFQDTPAWRAHVRKRMRTNAHLAIRHDAYRFMPPGSPRYVGKDVVRYFWPDPKNGQQRQANERKDQPDLATERRELLWMRSELAAIKANIKFRRLLRDSKAFNPNQPRIPAGNPDGGQWTDDETPVGKIRLAQAGGTLTDAWGQPYYNPGGHHELPKDIYEKWNLRPETLQVFKNATTGTIPEVGLRTTPEGDTFRHQWRGREGGLHGIYNEATKELSDRFLQRNGITPEQMTPDQAHALLRAIRESDDPRIRDYNTNLRRIRRLFRLRPGVD